MLGSDAPITWDVAAISQLLESPQAAADIASAPDSRYLPKEFWATIVASLPWLADGAIDRFAGNGPMITDDHPLTEYYVLHELFDVGHGPNVTETLLRRLA